MNGNYQRTNDHLLPFLTLVIEKEFSVFVCSLFMELFYDAEVRALLSDNNQQS